MLVDADRIVPPIAHQTGASVQSRPARTPAGAERGLDAGDGLLPPGLASFVATAFRHHRHLGNVLTHVSGGNWKRVEEALRAILDPSADSTNLTPLARNIVELMYADRGVTGRILKPYYQGLLISALGEDVARRVIANVMALFIEFETRGRDIARNRADARGNSKGNLQ